MMTEKDEFIYHEMITHVPIAVHPAPEKVLIIGAGDGGTLRELTRYNEVKHIDMVEIDRLVVEVCKKYLPSTACSFNDSRLNLLCEDGINFVKNIENRYDVIIVDSTDPFGYGEGLFSTEFYADCFKALRHDGILVNQHESPFYYEDAEAVKRTHKRIKHSFDISLVYQAHIPTYSSGHWLFGCASKKYHPIFDLNADKWNSLGISTKYYNTSLHKGAFCLPNYVQKILNSVS